METNDCLLNTVMASFSQNRPEKKFIELSGMPRKELGYIVKSKRRELASAHKFVIGNDAVKRALHASHMPLKDFVDIYSKAIPPFENMWVEWDEEFRRQCLKDFAKDKGFEFVTDPEKEKYDGSYVYGDRIKGTYGYHISACNISQTHPYSVGPPMEGVFSYQKYAGPPVTRSLMQWNCFFEAADRSGNGAVVFEEHLKNIKNSFAETIVDPDNNKGLYHTSCIRWLYGINPLEGVDIDNSQWYCDTVDVKHFKWLEKQLFAVPITYEKADLINDFHVAELQKQLSGDLRFLMTLIGLINYDLHVLEEAEPVERSKKTKYVNRVQVPKNELRVINIDIPKPKGVTITEKKFSGTGTPKREHIRRGHWHTYHYKNGTSRKKWVGEQRVGSADLGRIEHDYLVRENKGEEKWQKNLFTSVVKKMIGVLQRPFLTD